MPGSSPESTAHDCAIESMRHSSLWAEPSGVPSSNHARTYQSPSQAWSSRVASCTPSSRQRTTRARSPRRSAIRA